MKQLEDDLKAYQAACLDFPLLDRPLVLQQVTAIAQVLGVPKRPLSLADILQGELIGSERGLYLIEELPALLLKLQGWDRHQLESWLSQSVSMARSTQGKYFVLLNAQAAPLPDYLRPLIPSINWSLPGLSEIESILAQELNITESDLALSISGLSWEEIRLGVRLLDRDQPLKSQLIKFKQQQLRALGLEFLPSPNLPTFGGLERIKQAIAHVALDYSPNARELKIPFPKGWLLAGPPGTGKTFTAKVCAAKLGFPLISVGVDVVKSKGSHYLKQLLERIEMASPAVCYFDEFDKFFDPDAALTGGGQTKEVLGVLLTWLQEKQSQTFVIATLNRLDALPPELTRAGRFDRLFYVGFPSASERKEILQLHAAQYDARYGVGNGPLSERDWRILLNKTRKFTGAELQDIVTTAVKQQYYGGNRTIELTLDNFLAARAQKTSLFERDTERVLAMENRARYVCEPASEEDTSVFAPAKMNLWGESA